MKWFKHFTDASDDDFIEELENIFGLEGYARWWKMLEIIGSEMDKNRPEPSAVHTYEKWCQLLKAKRKKLDSFLVHCQNKSRIKLEPTGSNHKSNGNVLKITCPKLLDLRDEYYRKSGQPTDTLQTLPCLDIDTEVDKEKKVVLEGKPPNTYSRAFEEVWSGYLRRDGSKSAAQKSYNNLIKSGVTHGTIIDGVRAYRKFAERTALEIRFVPHFTTWLNQRRWETVDECIDQNSAAAPDGAPARSKWDVEADRLIADYDSGGRPERTETADCDPIAGVQTPAPVR